jgi:hypothetical protein
LVALALAGMILVHGASAEPASPVQGFNIDALSCIGATDPFTLTGSEGTGLPIDCPAENLAVNGAGTEDVTTAILIKSGNRIGLPFTYTGPGWGTPVNNDDLAVMGNVKSYIDAFCDGNFDIFASTVNNATGENFTDAGTVFDATSGPGNDPATSGPDYVDETYLNALVPPTGVMSRTARYRADVKRLWLDVAGANFGFALPDTTPLNAVILHPTWAPAGAQVSVTLLGGAPAPPSESFICLDSPQSSISTLTEASGAVSNPTSPGLYARWTTELSAADPALNQSTFKLITSCKHIGGTVPDADDDCLSDAADADDADPDQDNDGLLDGIEAAWGSSQTSADSDGDLRSDLEEMVGPSQFLTNPNVANTDSEGANDTGYVLDAADDGVPDAPDLNNDGVDDGTLGDASTACSADSDTDAGVLHRNCTWLLVDDGAGGSVGGFDKVEGGDPCPNNSAGGATNTDGGFAGGDPYGDGCDGDDDADGLVDPIDGGGSSLYFKNANVANRCTLDSASATLIAGLSPTDPDSDGDGYLDGVECSFRSNPGLATGASSTPNRMPASDADGDFLNLEQERFYRTYNFSGGASEDFEPDGVTGLDDIDADGDGLSDSCEALVTGTSPFKLDSDDDGTSDAAETGFFGSLPLGNGTLGGVGSSAHDLTVPASKLAGCGLDGDHDGLADATELAGAPCASATGATSVNYDFTWVGGKATSWDTDGDGVLDGAECALGTNPNSAASKPTTVACGGTGDTDGDGLKDAWETCKWGTLPTVGNTNSDGDDIGGDCKEAADIDGDKNVTFPGDVLGVAGMFFGGVQDVSADLDGDNNITFPGDVLGSAGYFFGATCL